jgi:outer membrane immunogenic protein
MIAGGNTASAQSPSSSDAILQRLDSIDKRNAKLESENAALRERVRILEQGHRMRAADERRASPAPASGQPREATSAMAMMPKTYASPAYKAPPVVPAAYSWTGFYVGANAGGGIGDRQWSDPTLAPPELGSHKTTGWLGGLQAGYNWQTGHLVLGAEGTYHVSDLRGDHQNTTVAALGPPVALPQFGVLTDRYSTRIDGIATLAGRIGFASDSLDRTLFYAKGGAAYASESTAQASNAGILLFGGGAPQAITFTGTRTGSDNRWGWMAGLGLEQGLTDNWSAKIEYNYLDFGTKSVRLSGFGCTASGGAQACASITSNPDVRQNAQLLTLGINYRFNNGPVMTKY